jgi:hypothetical protein
MSKTKMVVIACLLLFVFVRNGAIDFTPTPTPDPDVIVVPDVPDVPVVPVVEPSIEMKTLVKPLLALEIDVEDAALLKAYFTQLAATVKNDTKFITSTKVLREYIVTSGSLTFNSTDINDKYSVNDVTFGAFINKTYANVVGLENAAMDDTKRAASVEFFEAVAWSLNR